MNPLKNLIHRKPASRTAGRKNVTALAPLGVGMAVVALLMNLGLTQFLVRSYLAQDGFAVPTNSLSALLRGADDSGEVSLLEVEMGDAVYTRALGSRDYFIGEDKKAVSSGYPVYTREGQVLYFLDDSLKMVTEEWEALGSYDGL